MKEDLDKIYGNEWTWFMKLKLCHKLRVLYFMISMALAFGISDSWYGIAAIIANVIISSILLLEVPTDGIKEE